MTPRWDLAVIGAGPAGSALALSIARAGARVVLVEKTNFDRRRPGETASPACRGAIRALGLDRFAAPPFAVETPSIICVWGDDVARERDHIFSAHGHASQLDRRRFDAAFADEAAAGGASVLRGRSAGVERDEAGLQRVILSDGRVMAADYVAICDGRHSTGAGKRLERLGLNDHVCLAVHHAEPLGTTAMLVEAVPQGWLYAAAQPDGSTVVALTTRRALAAGRARRQALWHDAMRASTLLRRHLPQPEAIRRLMIWNSRASAARCVGGADWCLLGDSRFAMDPLSGRGIEAALSDAATAADFLSSGRTAQLATHLQARSARDLDSHTRATLALYGSERRFPGQGFW